MSRFAADHFAAAQAAKKGTSITSVMIMFAAE
jgi:hypothetical protein